MWPYSWAMKNAESWGPTRCRSDGVVEDDRPAVLIGDEGDVPERIRGDLLHVDQPLECLHSLRAAGQQ
jgi:hypothetical protein